MTKEELIKKLTTKTGRVFVSKSIASGNSPLSAEIVNLTDYLDSSYSIKERVMILQLGYIPVCKMCQKPVHGRFPTYCSKECQSSDHEFFQKVKDKRTKTMLERYGEEHALKNQTIKEKLFKTNLKRYGETCPRKSKIVKEKCKKTMLARYGKEHALQVPQFLEKSNSTCLKNFGVLNPMQNQAIREKSIQTLKEKYGVENPSQYDPFKTKRSTTNLERYGSVFGCRKNYSDELLEEIENEFRTIKSGKDTVFRSCSDSTRGKFLKKFRPELIHSSINIPHQYIISVLEEHRIFFEVNNRSILKPKEIDIWIPEFKTGIEINGIYWHSEKFKEKTYHFEKSILAKNLGITLIHLYDDLKLERSTTFLVNKLVHQKRIGARQCKIVLVSKEEEKLFLNNNHLNGYINSENCIGLTFEGDLIEVLSFGKPRFNKSYEFEILRLATKLGYQVVGGVSKLFKFWLSYKDPKSVITYSSLDWGANKTWEKIGFTFNRFTSPGYSWVNQYQTLSRYQTQKKNLKSILKNQFDENLTEDQNMIKAGWLKLYNAGNEIFYWKK